MKRDGRGLCTAWPPPTEPVKATKPMRGRRESRVGDLLMVDVQILEHAVGQAGCRERLGVALRDERRLLRHFQMTALPARRAGTTAFTEVSHG